MAYYQDFKNKKTRKEKLDQYWGEEEGRSRGGKGGKPAGHGKESGSRSFGRSSTGQKPYAPRGEKPASRGPGGRPSAGGYPPKREAAPAQRERPPREPKMTVAEATGFDTPYSREPENLLSGRNPIREALKADRDIEKLLVAKGDLTGSAREIVSMARERNIPVQVVDRARLDEITPHHQGILAFTSAYAYAEVDDMLALAREKNEQPLLVVLDGITDPHNLGAIIRTAACVGAHGVIVPTRRSVGLTPAAVKASAGAIETIKVARVTNLVSTLKELQKQGLWLYAADMEGEDYRKVKLEAPMALIIGSEGEGVSRLVLEHADFKVKLPMYGGVESLNASVAAGVLLYAAVSGRE